MQYIYGGNIKNFKDSELDIQSVSNIFVPARVGYLPLSTDKLHTRRCLAQRYLKRPVHGRLAYWVGILHNKKQDYHL
jgi:hypothetical protein